MVEFSILLNNVGDDLEVHVRLSHYSSKENGYAITQWILESSVSHTLTKPCRISSVFLPPRYTLEVSVSLFFQIQRIYNLTYEILVELVGRNQKLRTCVIYILLCILYTFFSSLFLHQIKTSIRAYMWVGGCMSGYCAEREFSTTIKAFAI